MIQFKDISFIYDGKLLFEHFTDEIGKNEKVVISGRSGAGKSTLLSALLGFARPASGIIRINEMPVDEAHITAIRKLTAYLPQEFTLPYHTVKELVRAPFEFRANRQQPFCESELFDLFDRLQLEHHLYEKQAAEISGGQRQRIMLVTALLMKRPILLIDEPTSALDADSIGHTIDLLKNHTPGCMVAVSHDERFARAFDRNMTID